MAALRTNFVLVDVDDAVVNVGKLAPYSEERHRALEDAHGNKYVFWRHADSLEAVRTNANAAILEMWFEKRAVSKLGKLLNVLVEQGFKRYVVKPKIAFVRRRPLTIVSLEPKSDLAHTLRDFAKYYAGSSRWTCSPALAVEAGTYPLRCRRKDSCP